MASSGISIRPMPIGAEVTGAPADGHVPEAVRAELYRAWLDHGFLLFRGVHGVEQQMALTRCFGDLEIHPFPAARHPDNPYLIELGKRPIRYVYDGRETRVNCIPWHRDTAYTPDICKGAMLRMLEVPAQGGETCLADTAKAYDGLPPRLKARLEGLEFKATLRTDHRTQTGPGALWGSVEREDGKPVDEDWAAVYPPVIHPALLVHPESGRKCVFLSPTYVDAFLGLEPAESRALLRELVDHLLQPAYVYAHRWTVGDAILWDNRRMMHASPGNDPSEPRYGVRTTLAGPTRTGRYFDPEPPARVAVPIVD
jgi:taurine dioxygenase